MDVDWATLVIQLLSGAVGGNLAGMALKNLSLGTVGNSVAGIVGGGLGGYLLQLLGVGADGGAFDIANLLTSVLGGGVGGGIVMAVVGYLRGMMGSSST
jgi:uncharacterized membrane protein YeaQ/YmgE (transglycosylase-associated protein family)